MRLAPIFCFLICSPVLAEKCPMEVRLGFPNFEVAPFLYGTEEMASPPGLIVDWVKNAIAKTGCKPKMTFHRSPSKRVFVDLRDGVLDMSPGLADSPEFKAVLAFPMRNGAINPDLVVLRVPVYLYVRADDQSVKWDGQRLQATNPVVGVSAGVAATQAIVNEYKWQTDVAVDPPGNLKKLIAKRIDVMMEPEFMLAPYLNDDVAKEIRKLLPPVSVNNRYAPVSKQFHQKYPEFTNHFWLEICKESRSMFPALSKCR